MLKKKQGQILVYNVGNFVSLCSKMQKNARRNYKLYRKLGS